MLFLDLFTIVGCRDIPDHPACLVLIKLGMAAERLQVFRRLSRQVTCPPTLCLSLWPHLLPDLSPISHVGHSWLLLHWVRSYFPPNPTLTYLTSRRSFNYTVWSVSAIASDNNEVFLTPVHMSIRTTQFHHNVHSHRDSYHSRESWSRPSTASRWDELHRWMSRNRRPCAL